VKSLCVNQLAFEDSYRVMNQEGVALDAWNPYAHVILIGKRRVIACSGAIDR
jgi:hypothetical protein